MGAGMEIPGSSAALEGEGTAAIAGTDNWAVVPP